MSKMRSGAQLFTVREFTKNLTDFAETLKKVADIGYSAVQVSATCAFEPEWLKEQLDKNGLCCSVTHADRDRIIHDTLAVSAEHKVFGCDYIGLGSMTQKDPKAISEEDYQNFIKEYIPAARIIAAQGQRFMYHNHHREFQRSAYGRIYFERLLADTKPEEMGIILDVYWVQVGGGDVVSWVRRLAGRVPCVHFKDLTIESQNQVMMPIGSGNMNVEGIAHACEDAGTKYLLVEQDECNGKDPFECLKKSYDYLKGLGIE